MSIKSLEELKKIRESAFDKMKIRTQLGDEDSKIEILVGMATCGIASGARQTMVAILDEISIQKLDNVKIIQVGCIGYCHSEPCIQVNVPGKEPVLYGKVDGDIGRKIVNKHIIEGNIVTEYVLDAKFDRA